MYLDNNNSEGEERRGGLGMIVNTIILVNIIHMNSFLESYSHCHVIFDESKNKERIIEISPIFDNPAISSLRWNSKAVTTGSYIDALLFVYDDCCSIKN